MSAPTTPATDVFSAREIARAAGVRTVVVERLIRAGTVPTIDGWFMSLRHARAVVRHLRTTPAPDPAARESAQIRGIRGGIRGGQVSIFSDNRDLTPPGNGRRAAQGGLIRGGQVSIFSDNRDLTPPGNGRRAAGRGLAASGAAHAVVLAVLAVVGAGGVQEARTPIAPAQPARLVFVATPGPGGGGGGGGLRHPAPPPRARLEGRAVVRSPVPPPRRPDARPAERRTVPPPPVRPRPVERPVEPPPAPRVTEPLPQVVAPVATVAADVADRAGILSDSALKTTRETTSETTSSGPGTGGGAGSGAGSGIGEGEGSGIGPGSGGGTGGGPYRPGSGITPPAIVREVKPQYTQDARRRAIEGDVVVEIIVRADGSVGQVRLLQGLGAGLDQRAIDAVRQWRFSPARRHGTPVDVVVEVAVEFKLR